MEQVSRALQFVFDLFRYHKLKILTVLLSAFAFFMLMFPFSDLSDLLTTQIMSATGNRIYFKAQGLNIGLLPVPSVSGNNVTVDVQGASTIEASELTIRPSLLSLWALRSGDIWKVSGSVSAEGLWGGNIHLSMSPAGTNDQGAAKSHLAADGQSIHLKDLENLFGNLPITAQGQASFQSTFDFYPGFEDQPEGQLSLVSQPLKIPPSNIPTDLGVVPIPGLNWSQVQMKGHLSNSTFVIDGVTLGTSKDPVYGRIKGQMNVRVDRRGPSIGNYDLTVELTFSRDARRAFQSFLSFIDSHKQELRGGGARYLFRARATNVNMPPSLESVSRF